MQIIDVVEYNTEILKAYICLHPLSQCNFAAIVFRSLRSLGTPLINTVSMKNSSPDRIEYVILYSMSTNEFLGFFKKKI